MIKTKIDQSHNLLSPLKNNGQWILFSGNNLLKKKIKIKKNLNKFTNINKPIIDCFTRNHPTIPQINQNLSCSSASGKSLKQNFNEHFFALCNCGTNTNTNKFTNLPILIHNNENNIKKNPSSLNLSRKINMNYFDNSPEGQKTKNHQFSLITALLNQKLSITPKIKHQQIKDFDSFNELKKMAIFKKFQNKLLANQRFVHHILLSQKKHKAKKFKTIDNNKNNDIDNIDNYEIVEYYGGKNKILNRLIVDNEEEKKNIFNIHYGNIYENLCNNYENISYKNLLNNVHNYYENNTKKHNASSVDEMDYIELRNMSKRGFAQLRKRELIKMNRRIFNTLKAIKDNRLQYRKTLDHSTLIFTRNKENILNSDL